MRQRLRTTGIAALLLLAACGQQSQDEKLSELDNQLATEGEDPALTSALADQITVDPALAQQSNGLAVRPAPTPVQARYPRRAEVRRSASAADRQREATVRAAEGEGSGCAGKVQIDPRWAARLPAAFGMLPGGKLTEAGGTDSGDCRFRVVTFTSGAAPQRVLAWYRDRAARAGYSAEQQVREGDQILAGTNQAGGAYYLIVSRMGAGSDVSLIVDAGR